MTPSHRTSAAMLVAMLALASGCSVIVNNKTQCTASECDDGNPCTNDYCGDGACHNDLIDQDGDGYAPSDCSQGDGGANLGDCDDDNSEVHPGAAEQCNGKDDNCNGLVDDGAPQVTCYRDADRDGYHDATMSMTATCTCPDGWILPNAAGADCLDSNVQVHPGAPEQCNNYIDDNCNGVTDEATTMITCQRDADGDGFGDASDTVMACACPASPRYIVPNPTGNDCADSIGQAYPGSAVGYQTVPYCLATQGGIQHDVPATPNGGSPTGYSCPANYIQRWDYNCDGTESQYLTRANASSDCSYYNCYYLGFCRYSCGDGWIGSTAADCGINAAMRDGGGIWPSCSCSDTTLRQSCR